MAKLLVDCLVKTTMHLVSFNVAGIKQVLSNAAAWNPSRKFADMFNLLEADLICFQETKLQAKDINREMVMVPGYNAFFTSSVYRKGYSGVAIYIRDSIGVVYAEEGLTGWLPSNRTNARGTAPLRYKDSQKPGSWGEYPELDEHSGIELDNQGRALCLDLGTFVVIGLYCPANSQGNMSEYRDAFFKALDFRVRSLISAGRKLVVMGDLNVAREPKDSATGRHELAKAKIPINREEWMSNSLPRRVVNSWVDCDDLALIDTGRTLHPDRDDMFTCWNQLINARPANFGSRIDYILASPEIPCVGADIMPEKWGSDHCPLWADLTIETLPALELPPLARRLRASFGSDIKALFAAAGSRQRGITTTSSACSTGPQVPVIASLPSRSKLEKSDRGNSGRIAKSKQMSLKRFASHGPEMSKTEESPTEESPGPTAVLSGHEDMIACKLGTTSANRTAWQSIFQKKPAPLCPGHSEPCILQRANKKGPNRGRYFWSCARPQGADGDERFRCNYFKWK